MKNSSRLRFRPCLFTLAAVALASSLAGHAATITQQALLKDFDPRGYENFGHSVAVSGDTAVIGTPYEPADGSTLGAAGAAYVFVRSGTNWALQAYLKAPNSLGAESPLYSGDFFGWSVAVSGDTVVVGAPQEDSNATGVNGNQSDNSARNSGAAYVFGRSGTNWILQAYLKASNAEGPWLPSFAGDRFGWSVAVSGETVLVGAPWEQSNATGVNGNQNDNSANNSGAAYVFVGSGTNWTQQAYLKASNTGPTNFFGSAVALSGDTLVVGASLEESNATGVNGDQNDNSAPRSGAAYVFVRSGTNWTQQAYLKASNPQGWEYWSDWFGGDRFGHSVAVSGDTVVVGAPQEDSNGLNGDQSNNSAPNSGAAYVFTRSGTDWTQDAYLKGSNTEGLERFGESVAVSGDMLVVGAPLGDYYESNNIPAAYVFGRSGTNWIEQACFTYLLQRSKFGFGVAISGDTVAVGAPRDGELASYESGAAYVFAGPPPDSDGDGVPDNLDQCPGTPAGIITDATGCSIEQLVPCNDPWRNHGEYLRALRGVLSSFVSQGLLNQEQAKDVLRSAINSECGKK